MALLTHVGNSPFPLFNGGCGRQKVTKRGWICNFHEKSGEGGGSAKKKVSLMSMSLVQNLVGKGFVVFDPLYI